jgi:hypothetical protein
LIREWDWEWELSFEKFPPEWEFRIAILFNFRCELPRFLGQLLISEEVDKISDAFIN